MRKLHKIKITKRYKEILDTNKYLLFLKNSGLKVHQSSLIRKNLYYSNNKLLFIKNKLFENSYSNKSILNLNEGNIVAYGSNLISLSKSIVRFSKNMPVSIMFALANGKIFKKEIIEHISNFQCEAAVYSQIINLLNSNCKKLITVINESNLKILRLIINKK
jgi:ribosomal protein L10